MLTHIAKHLSNAYSYCETYTMFITYIYIISHVASGILGYGKTEKRRFDREAALPSLNSSCYI